jgi:hypothetical protein
MSLRSDIIGWVIRRLADIDATDSRQRAALFQTLRGEIEAEGFGGAPPAQALPHFESAAAMQETYWLRETPGATTAEPPAEPAKPPRVSSTAWQWPKRLRVPLKPPGPAPGEPVGPFADHVYDTVSLVIPGGTTPLNLGWTYDPACILTASAPEIGFSFKTRAASFAAAVDHLAAVLACAKLELPAAVRGLDL